MPKRLFLILFTICALVIKPVDAKAAFKPKNILVLFSLSPLTPAYRAMLDGMRQRISDEYGDAYNLHIEYLETEEYPTGQYPEQKFKLINTKYDEIKPDVIIYVGINAISVVKKYASLPMLERLAVSLEIDYSKYGLKSDIKINERTAVVKLNFQIDKTLEYAFQLFPNTESIYFICGTSRVDSIYTLMTESSVKKLKKNKNLIFVRDKSMDEILHITQKLPQHSIIVIPTFGSDARGVQYYTTETVRMIRKMANAPVFVYSNMGIGEGAIGGYILNFTRAGKLAADATLEMLKTNKPYQINVSEKDYYEYMFDGRELKRWKTPASRIPNDSNILFHELSFFEKYLWVVVTVVIVLVLQLIFIVKLIRMNRQHKEINKRLIETENSFKNIYREDRILRIGQLTASLSHELNQPLTAILSLSQAGIRIIDFPNNDPELIKEIFNNIIEDNKRAIAVLSSLRGMIKHEKRIKGRVNLNNIITNVVNLLHSRSIELKYQIITEFTSEEVFVLADAIQIQQVLMNLITNASHSVVKSEPKNRTIILNEKTNESVVTISVRDYGSGIDNDLQDKIFKPFVSSKKDGLGIGLAICKTIIEEHEGKIWAENMPDGGAKFSFNLNIYHA